MAIEYLENKAIFKEVVTIEEAEELFNWLLSQDEVEIDMTECIHIHTAILQLIHLFKSKLKLKLSADSDLQTWITGGD